MKTIPHTNSVRRTVSSAALLACFLIATRAIAANFTTTVQQGTTAHWAQTIWQPGGVAPSSGNTYQCIAGGNPTRVRNPASGSGDPVIGVKTFPGDSLQLDAASEIRSKGVGNTLDFPGVGGSAGLIMNGGNIDTGDDGVFALTGVVLVQADSRISCGDATQVGRGWQIGAQIRGSANWQITKQVASTASTAPAVELTGGNNPFSGRWIVRSGLLRASGAGSVDFASITLTATNAGIIPQFEPMYDVRSAGVLTLTNGGQIILHQVCSFSSVFIDATPLSPGLHTYADLNASYPANFPAGGSGSLSVQPPAPPSTPTNIVVINGDSQVTLSWSPANFAASYNVKRSDSSSGPYFTVGAPTGASFTDGALLNGRTYYYVVSAVNVLGESADSVPAVGRPNIPVTGLVATGGTGQVALVWNTLGGATGYRVQRGTTAGGPYTNIATGIVANSYVDTTVLSGRTYFYTVVGSLAGGESGISNEGMGTTVPGTPSNVTASLLAATVVQLGWTLTDPVITQISIERSTDGVNFSPIASPPTNQKLYNDTGLTLGTTYFYRLQAQNAGGFSGYSVVVSNLTPTAGWNVNFANASFATNFPGYVNDYSLIFGDRGNGYSYGWDADNSANARERNAATPLDKRYDTFTHLMKQVPSLIWEIEIPNGFYWVRIVSTDLGGATDATYQFDVEGNITPAIAAVANQPAGFTNTALVSDGRLTINSGPSAANNKIAFIDVYPAIGVPIFITTNPPALTTLVQNRPLALSVGITNGPFPGNAPYFGFQPVFYQWFHDGLAVPDGTNATLSRPLAQTADSGNYYVIASNIVSTSTSTVATVTVTADTVGPKIVSVGSLDGYSIGVCFDELVNTNGANPPVLDLFSYSVNGGTMGVNAVVLRPDNRSVQLILDAVFGPLAGEFHVTATGILDLAGNGAGESSSGTNTVMGLTAQDIGTPAFTGTNYVCDGNTIELVGSGADIWGTADQFHLASKSANGDFDARVRVVSLRGANAITKAALMVRETADPGSRTLHLSVNPVPPGRDQFQPGVRDVTGGGYAYWGTNYVPSAIPNAWLRITRIGDTFQGYRSTNGVDWILMAQTNQTYPTAVLVGLGVTAHDNTLLATGAFSGFSVVAITGTDVGVAKIAAQPVVPLGSNLTYTVTVTNLGPAGASGVTLTDPLPAGVTFVSATSSQGSCGQTAGTVTCNLGDLAVAASARVTIVGLAATTGSKVNTATVTAVGADPDPGNNTASATVTVPVPPTITPPVVSGGTVGFSIATQPGVTYQVYYKNSLDEATWTLLTTISGDGTVKPVTDPGPLPPTRFYTVRP